MAEATETHPLIDTNEEEEEPKPCSAWAPCTVAGGVAGAGIAAAAFDIGSTFHPEIALLKLAGAVALGAGLFGGTACLFGNPSPCPSSCAPNTQSNGGTRARHAPLDTTIEQAPQRQPTP
jgi:hypothetical protein